MWIYLHESVYASIKFIRQLFYAKVRNFSFIQLWGVYVSGTTDTATLGNKKYSSRLKIGFCFTVSNTPNLQKWTASFYGLVKLAWNLKILIAGSQEGWHDIITILLPLTRIFLRIKMLMYIHIQFRTWSKKITFIFFQLHVLQLPSKNTDGQKII